MVISHQFALKVAVGLDTHAVPFHSFEESLHTISEYNVVFSVTYAEFPNVKACVLSASVYHVSVAPFTENVGLYDVVIESHRLTFFVSTVSPLREKVKALVEEFLKQRTENP